MLLSFWSDNIEQVELGRKYDDLELLKNDTHPQFNLIKVTDILHFLLFLSQIFSFYS